MAGGREQTPALALRHFGPGVKDAIFRRVWGPRLTGLALVLGALGAWEVCSRLQLGGLRIWLFFVPPSRVVTTGADMIVSGQLHPHVFISLMRLLAGMGIAVLLGVFAGLVIGWWRRIDQALGPLVELMRPMPKAALFPVLILLTGIGEASKIIFIAFSIFFIICINSIYGARGVDRVLVDSLRAMGASGWQIFRKAVLPSALSHVAVGLRISVAASLTMLTFAEMLASNSGIGFLVLLAQRTYRYEMMFVGIFSMCLIGGTAAYLCMWVERRVLGWYHATRAVAG